MTPIANKYRGDFLKTFFDKSLLKHEHLNRNQVKYFKLLLFLKHSGDESSEVNNITI